MLMRSPAERMLRRYAVCFAAWTVMSLFGTTQGLTQKVISGDPTPAWHYVVVYLSGSYIAALFTPLVFWLGTKFPIGRRNWYRSVPLHLVFSLCFSIVVMTLLSLLLPALGMFPSVMKTPVITFTILLMTAFHQDIAVYWTLIGLQYGFRYYRQYREREEEAMRLELRTSELQTQLAHAHLNALKMQLHPHFLFNTLNAIMVLVRQKRTPEAEEMLARLSDLLRCVLEEVQTQEVPLRHEIEYLQLYLSIEQIRFQDRLRVEIAVDSALLNPAVPHMVLQPIVENAIRHGVGRRSTAGAVRISAARIGDSLELVVEDDGPGFGPADSVNGNGIGLSNTRARLETLYGPAAYLTIETAERGGARVRITLPWRVVAVDTAELQEVHAL